MTVIKDWRYLVYYIFTASVVAIMLAVEDAMEELSAHWYDYIIDFFLSIPPLAMVTLIVSFISYPIIVALNKHFPWETASWKRVILEVSILVLLVIFLSVIINMVINVVMTFIQTDSPEFDHNDSGFEGFTLALVMLFITFFMIFSFHEFMLISNDKAHLSYRAQMLEKQNYLMKYEALKSQVNPHFLFNSLNVLSSLIYTDTAKSDLFIQKFSDVFRYVLELNQEKVVQVRQELRFLDSYLYLQKIRYGESLIIHQNLSVNILEMYLPPLTLQLVVENAIKHNVIDKKRTLEIYISNSSSEVIVTNNLQRRTNLEESTGIGQKNLMAKYELMTDRIPQFYIENNHYEAKLPVLETQEWKEY